MCEYLFPPGCVSPCSIVFCPTVDGWMDVQTTIHHTHDGASPHHDSPSYPTFLSYLRTCQSRTPSFVTNTPFFDFPFSSSLLTFIPHPPSPILHPPSILPPSSLHPHTYLTAPSSFSVTHRHIHLVTRFTPHPKTFFPLRSCLRIDQLFTSTKVAFHILSLFPTRPVSWWHRHRLVLSLLCLTHSQLHPPPWPTQTLLPSPSLTHLQLLLLLQLHLRLRLPRLHLLPLLHLP